MKFVVSSSELLSGLLSISKVVSNKNTLPILDNFLLQLHDNVLRITGSDLETTLQVDLSIDNVEKEGSAAIPAKLIIDTLKEFPDQPLVIVIDETTLMAEISWSTGKFNIPCASADEYPQAAKLGESATSIDVESSALLEGISKTIFAVADDELRPVMSGILFDLNETALTFVATDAHKLVRYALTNITHANPCSFILPKKPANLLKAIIGKDKALVNLQFDSKNACFSTPRFRMICRLVEGTFPAYNTVIPTKNPHKLTVDRLDFMAAVKRVSVFSNQSSNLIRLKMTGNEMVITAQDLDFSMSAIERVSCSFDGEDLQIGFKSNFLVEILASLSSTNVVVELSDPGRAGIFLPFESENENEDILMLLMPMMVGLG